MDLHRFILFSVKLGIHTLKIEFETNTLFLSNPDVNLYNKTVIDYFGGEYGFILPQNHILTLASPQSVCNFKGQYPYTPPKNSIIV